MAELEIISLKITISGEMLSELQEDPQDREYWIRVIAEKLALNLAADLEQMRFSPGDTFTLNIQWVKEK